MILPAQRLTAEGFAPFGRVVEIGGASVPINEGLCRRYHDLARPVATDGAVGISLFKSAIRPVPYSFDLLERHPLGSQCFLPMDGSEYLVIAAPDHGGVPGAPLAFLAGAGQGVDYAPGTWHGVLAPISGGGLFAVVDRIGAGANLEEHRLPAPLTVMA